MNGRTRFAKCFIIIVEQCKSWLVVFAENRVITGPGSPTVHTLKQFINANTTLSNDPMIKSSLKKMKTSADLDISALRSVIIFGNLLRSGEMKTIGHAGKTIGDYVDRIREIRNNFMHTASANLVEQDYNDYLEEFRDIASRFETENKVSAGCYVKEIEKINEEPLDSEAVEETIIRFNVYLQIIIKIELPEIPSLLESLSTFQNETRIPTPPPARQASFVDHEQGCLTKQLALGFAINVATRTDDTTAQAVGAIAGGAIGLAVDVANAPRRIIEGGKRISHQHHRPLHSTWGKLRSLRLFKI